MISQQTKHEAKQLDDYLGIDYAVDAIDNDLIIINCIEVEGKFEYTGTMLFFENQLVEKFDDSFPFREIAGAIQDRVREENLKNQDIRNFAREDLNAYNYEIYPSESVIITNANNRQIKALFNQFNANPDISCEISFHEYVRRNGFVAVSAQQSVTQLKA